jgi:colanic acid biosynthesis glycosyl transferase WcaI
MSRVLLHSLVFPPDGVSTAYLMADLATELKKLGHSVTVLSTTPHFNIQKDTLARQSMEKRWGGLIYYSEYSGIPVWHIKIPIKGKRIWARAVDYIRFHLMSIIVGIFILGPQDIVIATSPPLTLGVMSWLLSLRWKAPSVYKVAEIYPDLAIRQGVVRNPFLISMMKWLEQFVYKHNTMIVPIAENFRQLIKQRNVPDKKLCLIPDSVDVELYQPLARRNSFSEANGLEKDFVVLYGGNIGIVQDWESVLFAAEKVMDLPIKFVIVGGGAQEEWLYNEVKVRNLSNVLLFGYQPKELMSQINASCDIGTIPLTRTGALDGFPSKIYTIMACGKPVIASAESDSEMAYLIARSGCGRSVPPEDRQAFVDAVLKSFREREMLPAEGERGRRFVEQDYSKQAIARKYDALIHHLLEH